MNTDEIVENSAVSGQRALDPQQARMWLIYIRVLLRISYEMSRELQIDSGLSLSDYHVLNALAGHAEQRMPITAIATRIGWERSRASHHVKRMSQRQLVTLERALTDRRSTDVVLTSQGLDLYRSANPGHMALIRRLFISGIEPGLLEPVTTALESVYENLIALGSLPRPDFPSGDDVGREAEVTETARKSSAREREHASSLESTDQRGRNKQHQGVIDRLFDAAEATILDIGVRELSVAAVAERAQIEVKTASELFPDKYRLLRFVGSRLLSELDSARLADIHAEERADWHKLCSGFIDRTADFYNKRPAARMLLLSDDGSGEIHRADQASDGAFIELIRRQFSDGSEPSKLPDPRLDINVLMVAVEIVDAVLALGSRQNDHEIPVRYIEEAKRVCHAYLSTYLELSPSY